MATATTHAPTLGWSDLPASLTSRIAVVDGHWLWTGQVDKDGYGRYDGPLARTAGQRTMRAHRVVWLVLGGTLPEHLHHHDCPHKNCVRPSCLEPMSAKDHAILHSSPQVSCKRGHEFTIENTSWRMGASGRPTRLCRKCAAARAAARWANLPPETTQAINRRTVDKARARRHATVGV